LDDKITSRKSQIRNSEEFIFISNKPSLLIVISNKWVVHISQPSLDNAFHDLKQKWLMLGVNILNTLLKNSEWKIFFKHEDLDWIIKDMVQ